MPTKIFSSKKERQGKIKRIAILDVARTDQERPSYDENQYNLALGYIGKPLLNEGYQVMISQQDPKLETLDDVSKEVTQFAPDVIAFASHSYQFERTKDFKNSLIAKLTRKPISLIGGIHASTSPEECTDCFDYVVVGEGEETVIELMKTLDGGRDVDKVQGIAYKSRGEFRLAGKRPRLQDLDKYGFPLRLDFPLARAGMITPVPDKIIGFAPIIFGRGCVKACTFCTNKTVYGSGKGAHVSRDPKKVVDEIEELGGQGINYFWTHDEDILADSEFLQRFCREVIDRKSLGKLGRIHFGGMGSISGLLRNGKINKSLITLLAEAGCTELSFGIERTGDASLRAICKGITTRGTEEVVGAVYETGIAPVGLFVYGLKEESEESLKQMKDFAKNLPLIRYRFAPAYPLKGTIFREQADKEELWLDEKFKQNRFANTETPVIKNYVAHSPDDAGYTLLRDYERNCLRDIYGSEVYANRIKLFLKNTGNRFKKFFSTTWKEYAKSELVGVQPKW
jgi:radical SAM superfamily enzyme YgiQ (UPF0313 family)